MINTPPPPQSAAAQADSLLLDAEITRLLILIQVEAADALAAKARGIEAARQAARPQLVTPASVNQPDLAQAARRLLMEAQARLNNILELAGRIDQMLKGSPSQDGTEPSPGGAGAGLKLSN